MHGWRGDDVDKEKLKLLNHNGIILSLVYLLNYKLINKTHLRNKPRTV